MSTENLKYISARFWSNSKQ